MVFVLGLTFILTLLLSYTSLADREYLFIILISLLLAVIAFFFDPVVAYIENGDYTDLYRIFNEIDAFRTYGWHASDSIANSYIITTDYNSILIAKIYMYLIAVCTKNDSYVSLINTFLTYASLGWGLALVGKKFNVKSVEVVSAFVFFILINDYSKVITNIRMPLAISIFILVWCIQIVHGKKMWQYGVYILLGLLHSSIFLYLLIKLLVDFLPRKFHNFLLLVMLMSSALLEPLVTLLTSLSGLGDIFRSLLQKVLLYSGDGTKVGISALVDNKGAVVMNFIRIFSFFVLLYTMRRIMSKSKFDVEDNVALRDLVSFGEMLVALSLGAIWSFHLFDRTALFTLAIMPIFMIIIAREKRDRILSVRRFDFFTALSWFMVVCSCGYYFLGFTYQRLVF